MSAPLRWTMALAAVGALGFAAGRYLGSDRPPLPFEATFPILASSVPASIDTRTPAGTDRQKLPATLHEIMKLQGDFAQSAMLYIVAAGVDGQGIERLLEEAESIERDSERRAAASILYQRYAELDPVAAVDHILRREAGFDPNWLYAVFHVWARTDLEGALAHAARLDDREREMAGTAMARSRDDLPTSEREALGSKLDVRVTVRDPALTNLHTPEAAERAWQTALAISDRESRQMGALHGHTGVGAKGSGRSDPGNRVAARPKRAGTTPPARTAIVGAEGSAGSRRLDTRTAAVIRANATAGGRPEFAREEAASHRHGHGGAVVAGGEGPVIASVFVPSGRCRPPISP